MLLSRKDIADNPGLAAAGGKIALQSQPPHNDVLKRPTPVTDAEIRIENTIIEKSARNSPPTRC